VLAQAQETYLRLSTLRGLRATHQLAAERLRNLTAGWRAAAAIRALLAEAEELRGGAFAA
jgi:hypothetical protein